MLRKLTRQVRHDGFCRRYRHRTKQCILPERLLWNFSHATQQHRCQNQYQTSRKAKQSAQSAICQRQARRLDHGIQRHRQQTHQNTYADEQGQKRHNQPQCVALDHLRQPRCNRLAVGICHHKRDNPAQQRKNFLHQATQSTDQYRTGQYEQHQIIKYRHDQSTSLHRPKLTARINAPSWFPSTQCRSAWHVPSPPLLHWQTGQPVREYAHRTLSIPSVYTFSARLTVISFVTR